MFNRSIRAYSKIIENGLLTRVRNKDHYQPFENPEQVFRSSRKLSKTQSLGYLNSPKFNLISDLEDQFEEEETEAMAET
ncbi:hypothetical protein Tco_0647630 [Tanacetum coccineum]